MRRKLTRIIVSLVMVSAFLVNGTQTLAATKMWKLYHNQGAPSNAGILECTRNMPAGGTAVAVTMTTYNNLSDTTIRTYKASDPTNRKYLTRSTPQQVLYVDAKKAANIVVTLSTSSAKNTSAEGMIVR